jgi:hypothetical protein
MARRRRCSSQLKARIALELLKEEKTVGELSAHAPHVNLSSF